MDQTGLIKNEHGNIESSLNFVLKQQISKKAKMIDIGCRYGSLIYRLYRLGYGEIYGCDINKKALDIGKRSYREISEKLRWYNGKQIPFDNNTFDVVMMFDVIEHIPSLEKYLKEEVYRVLKKDGLLLFQTPNKYINIPWEIITQRSFTRWRSYHCSLQTKHSLFNLLCSSGFDAINIEKHTIITEHNKVKAQKYLGLPGLFLLNLLSRMPLLLYPNFWGSARKKA